MAAGQSIANIRLLYNIPASTPDSEVIKFAADNNIIIDFSASANKAGTFNTFKPDPNASLFSANNQGSNGSNSGIGLNFSGNTNQNNVNEQSLFSFNRSNSLQNTELMFNKPEFLKETSKTSFLNNFLSSSMFKSNFSNKPANVFADNNAEINMADVVSQEFLDGGKMRFTMADGSVVEKQLSDEMMKQTGTERQLSKIEYVDGKVMYYDVNGNKIEDKTRDARFGENGYVKDGNSIEEDIVSVLGEKKLNNAHEDIAKWKGEISDLEASLEQYTDERIAQVATQNPEQAKELKKIQTDLKNKKAKLEKKIFEKNKSIASDYIKKVYKECNGDPVEFQKRLGNIIKNSNLDTDVAQQMVHIVGEFQRRAKDAGLSREQMAQLFVDMMDPSRQNGDEVVEAMADPVSRTGGDVAVAYADAAIESGREQVASNAIVENIENVIDPETGVVDIENAEILGQQVIRLTGDNGAIALANKVADTESDDLKVTTAGVVDEQAATSGNKDVINASIDVVTSIEDAEKQVKANEHSHEVYEEKGASDEVKKARAEAVGSRIGDYHEDAQLDVDETERKYDIEDTYLLAASQSIQNVAEKNQREMVQRVIDSGNDEAMSNVASHAYDYDISNRDDIIRMINEHGTDGAKQILEEKTKEYEEQVDAAKARTETQKAMEKAKNEANSQKTTSENAQTQQNKTTVKSTNTNSTKETSSRGVGSANIQRANLNTVKSMMHGVSATELVSTDAFKSLSAKDSVEIIKSMNSTDRKVAIQSIVERSEGIALQGYMYSEMKNPIIEYLVTHPTPKNQSKLQFIERFLNAEDKRFMDKVKEQNKGLAQVDQQPQPRKMFNFEA